MNHVFPRNTKQSLPTAVAGEGCYLIDTAGKRYLDASCGAAVSCLGHSDKSVVEAIKRQLDLLPFAHTSFFTSEAAEALADKLIAHAPPGIERVYFLSGGSEAIEAGIKLARQYFVETGRPERRHIVARQQSYHGNTLGALSAGGNMARRSVFEPLLVEMSHIAPCYAYRGQAEGESLEAYGNRMADALEEEILRLGPESVAAFIAEPVVGATLGAVTAAPGYFKRVREICDRHGVLLLLDEVMCGMGRTGSLFACEQEGISPDLVAVAKGLGAGYQAIGALLCTGEIYQAFVEGSGAFMHGHTYVGHPTACAGGLAVMQRLIDDGLVAGVHGKGAGIRQRLEERFGQHAHVGDIRGRGLFIGVELVADRETKAPFDPALRINAGIKAAAQEAGLICYPFGGSVDGKRGDHILLAPPFIIEEPQMDELVDKLEASIERVLTESRVTL